MASPSTRSSRRTGRLLTRSELTLQQNNAQNRQTVPNPSRRKRPRDSSDHIEDIISPKKPRIAIEIESRPKAQVKKREIQSLVIASDATSGVLQQRSIHIHNTTRTASEARIPTKYAEKVANGVRHELDRLQPSEA